MKAIDIKMLRDLKKMGGQIVAIAFVIVAGISVYVTMSSVAKTLKQTLDTYYTEFAFADGFASVIRVPESMAERLGEVPGISQVETRVSASVNVEISDFDEPITGQILSIPDVGPPALNRLFLRKGRVPSPGKEDEVILNEVFAEAHALQLNNEITIIINGNRRRLTIVGIALSPEFIYQLKPGMLFPDPERHGVMWMNQSALAAAFNMEGAFNDVAFTLAPGARVEDVIDRMDAHLNRYGGQGAYARADQASDNLISQELDQLKSMAFMLPLIILAVAAFLLNIVVSRLISLQREQIAILKAFGYSRFAVAMHYIKLILLVALSGAIIGIALGIWMGGAMAEFYLEYFKFPYLKYNLHWTIILTAVVLTAGAALAGTLFAVNKALRLPPAEAMKPAPPAKFRQTLVERLGLERLFDQPSRIILRNLERQWVKAGLTVIGIASSCAILIMGLFWGDVFDYIIRVQYGIAQREDFTVTFIEPTSYAATYELQNLPEVQYVEPFRSVPVRLRHEYRTYDIGIEGIAPKSYLRRIIDADLQPIPIPEQGLILSRNLAEILQVKPGDELTVEVKEGRRYERRVPIVGLTKQYLGSGAYMELSAANNLAGEGDALSGVFLMIDEVYEDELIAALQGSPQVAGIVSQERTIASFMETSAEVLLVFTFILSLFAGIIALGVVYNSVRISLSERERELASMRVLGFKRSEIAYILLGEMAVLVMLAIPIGFGIGVFLSKLSIESLKTDMYQFPFVLGSSTFSLAATIILLSAMISALLVRQRLNNLDLVGVLKTRE